MNVYEKYPDRMKWCLKCGMIAHEIPFYSPSHGEYNDDLLHEGCGGEIGSLSDITHAQYDAMSQVEKDALQAKCDTRVAADRAFDERQHAEYRAAHANDPKCPTCGSTSISKITATSRFASVFAWGLASTSIGKQFKCEHCGYKW
ncbi:MAG: hypothetical protein RR653_12755 [Clostridia bacterium]